MATLKKYNLKGEVVGSIDVSDEMLDLTVNSQMLKDYLVAIRANKRQWSANTKGRSEVKCSTKKPHPQKGTGRARQGTLVAPQYRGGGIVFGPKPKFDQHVRINKKERRQAIRYLISEKIKAGKLYVLDGYEMDAPKTRAVADFLKNVGVDGKRVLFLGEDNTHLETPEALFSSITRQDVLIKSMRNIPKTRFMHACNVSGYDMALEGAVVVLDEAVQDLMLMLGA